ncbi:MAG: helix-turn-helix domain-containing protein [Eubacteriales bacterium]|nr:helix-turn-helix domain-containing protein [Eubacteriales bacterium]
MNKDKLKRIVSERLQNLLTGCGVTRTQLADRVDISYGSLASYLSARALPPLDVAVKLSKALGTSVDYLCGYEVPTQCAPVTPIASGAADLEAQALLRTLFRSAKALNFSPEMPQSTEVALKSHNALMCLFFAQASTCKTDDDLEAVLAAFAGVRVHNGELVDPVTYKLLYDTPKAGE